MFQLKNKFVLGLFLLMLAGCFADVQEDNLSNDSNVTREGKTKVLKKDNENVPKVKKNKPVFGNNPSRDLSDIWWKKGAKLNAPTVGYYLEKIKQADFAQPLEIINQSFGLVQMDVIGKNPAAPGEIKKYIQHLDDAPSSYFCSDRTGICRFSENIKGFRFTPTIGYQGVVPLYPSFDPEGLEAELYDVTISFISPMNQSVDLDPNNPDLDLLAIQYEFASGVKYLSDNQLIPFKYTKEIENAIFEALDIFSPNFERYEPKILAIENGLILHLTVWRQDIYIDVSPEQYE